MAEKVIEIFEHQNAREEKFNLLTLPLELQVKIFARLSQSDLAHLTQVSTFHKKLVDNYSQNAIELNLLYEPNITGNFLAALSKLYSNLRRIIIYNSEIKTSFDISLISILTQKFPKLIYIKLLNHVNLILTVEHPILELLRCWRYENLNRVVEYSEITSKTVPSKNGSYTINWRTIKRLLPPDDSLVPDTSELASNFKPPSF